MIGAEVPVADDNGPPRRSVRTSDVELPQVIVERHPRSGQISGFFHRCGPVPRDARQLEQALAVGDAQQRVLDLRAIDLQDEIVPQAFCARDF